MARQTEFEIKVNYVVASICLVTGGSAIVAGFIIALLYGKPGYPVIAASAMLFLAGMLAAMGPSENKGLEEP